MKIRTIDSAQYCDLNPGGAVIPIFQRYDTSHLARYELAVREIRQGLCVDYGCGYGFGAYLLAKSRTEPTIGLDIDRRCIRYASARYKLPNLRYKLLSRVEIPVPAQSVGLLTAFEVIEHMREPQVHQLFSEIRRSLRPDGMAILSTPNAEVPHEDFTFHIREYTADQLEALTSAHGFRTEVLGQGGMSPGQAKSFLSMSSLLPRFLKRAYSLRILHSLFLSIMSERSSTNDSAVRIGPFDRRVSFGVIFLLELRSLPI